MDGMAIDVLPVEEHGRANAFMAFGQVAGISISTAVSAVVVITFGMPGHSSVSLCVAFRLDPERRCRLCASGPARKSCRGQQAVASQRSIDMKPGELEE